MRQGWGSGSYLVKALEGEVRALGADVLGQLVVEGLDGARVRDTARTRGSGGRNVHVHVQGHVTQGPATDKKCSSLVVRLLCLHQLESMVWLPISNQGVDDSCS